MSRLLPASAHEHEFWLMPNLSHFASALIEN
jgi:hypothetical protein